MIERTRYVEALMKKRWNGRIKVITGIRRCGKSTIVFKLFKKQLLKTETDKEHIIEIALDEDKYAKLRDPEELSIYIRKKIKSTKDRYFVLIDEIQLAISSEELKNPDVPVRIYGILNELLNRENVDVYVTGSNSKLLSKDIATEFRGRGDVVHVYPLSFAEFFSGYKGDKRDAYDEYLMYGGMPYLSHIDTDEEKYTYLSELFEEVYFKDIEGRYRIDLPGVLRGMTSFLCSSVGSLTNASKISRTIKTTQNVTADPETINTYLKYLQDAFLFSEAVRYDVVFLY